MSMAQIRALAHELFDQLTRERNVDAQTGFELGRLSAALTMLTGGPPIRDPNLRTRASDREVHVPLPALAPSGSSGGNGAAHPPAASNGAPRKRVRLEKRPMRKAERVLTGPAGHTVAYNFETFTITDTPAKGAAPRIETVATRKELWDRLKKQKKEFKAAAK
jgi:hypothetical protein